MKFIILALIFWVIFRVVVKYIIPIFRMTRAASAQMRQMQEQMNNMQNNNRPQAAPTVKSSSAKEGDYIDYEEVR